jgi:7,8-dihydropterin-6-yl-methyl-4-(beta-D-ribofuranosyl)aminobenzene 5'-phosphate synthase
MTFTITETFNNIPFRHDLQTSWGFSCYVSELRLLFDTGGVGAILLNNLAILGIRPEEIETLVLSHDHWDHTGGIGALLAINPDIKIYSPQTLSQKTSETLNQAKEHIKVEDYCDIGGRAALTGQLGIRGDLGHNIPEQSLILNTPAGLYIVTGCAHPHAALIIRTAAEHGQVHGIIGGLHSVTEDDMHALSSLSYVSASHCTQALPDIVRRCRQNFVPGGVGKVHRI